MAVLSTRTFPNISSLNSFYYDNINHVGSILATDSESESSSRLDLPALNLLSSVPPKPSFETTVLPGESVIKLRLR